MTLLSEKHRPKGLNEVFFHKKEANQLKKQIKESGLPHLLISGLEESVKENFLYAIGYEVFEEKINNNVEFCSVEEFFSTNKTTLQDDTKYKRYFDEAKEEINRTYDKYNIDKRKSTVSKETGFKQYIKSISGNKPVGKNKYRLFVLFEASRLTENVQNSLRRMMENYSSTTRFAFILKNSSSLIPAIRSRCFEIHLNNPSKEKIKKKLTEVIQEEKIDISEEALDAVVYLTNENYNGSLNLIDALDSLTNKQITIEEVQELSEEIKIKNYEISLKKAINGEVKEATDYIDELIFEGNIKYSELIEEWRKKTHKLSIDDETKKDLLIKLSTLDKDIQELPRDPNQMRKLGRTYYEKYLSSIAKR